MNSSYNNHVMEARNRPPGLLVQKLIDQILNKRNGEVLDVRCGESDCDRRCIGPDNILRLRERGRTTLTVRCQLSGEHQLMGTTYYYTANNEMIGEHTLGQSRIDYLTDSLGSVVTTVDQSLTVVSTARYKPYGADLATTGTMPSFGYVGSLGYRRTKLPYSDLYVRKRHLASVEGRWSTVDPLWPYQKPYTYVRGRPTCVYDFFGLSEGGGISVGTGSNCSSLEFTTPPIGLWSATIALELCYDCYQCKCQTGNFASSCTTAGVDVSLNFGLSFELLQEISQVTNIEKWLSATLGVLVGLAGATKQCLNPVAACVEKEPCKSEVKACLKVCAGFEEISVCTGEPGQFVVSVNSGWCGLPKVSLSVDFEEKCCS